MPKLYLVLPPQTTPASAKKEGLESRGYACDLSSPCAFIAVLSVAFVAF